MRLHLGAPTNAASNPGPARFGEPPPRTLQPRRTADRCGLATPLESDMGTTRIEQAIDEFDTLGDESETSCDDMRLAWLADELSAEDRDGSDFHVLWADR